MVPAYLGAWACIMMARASSGRSLPTASVGRLQSSQRSGARLSQVSRVEKTGSRPLKESAELASRGKLNNGDFGQDGPETRANANAIYTESTSTPLPIAASDRPSTCESFIRVMGVETVRGNVEQKEREVSRCPGARWTESGRDMRGPSTLWRVSTRARGILSQCTAAAASRIGRCRGHCPRRQ